MTPAGGVVPKLGTGGKAWRFALFQGERFSLTLREEHVGEETMMASTAFYMPLGVLLAHPGPIS
jgi:hypothetical protein